MPLPRFHRLAPLERARILAIATRNVADHGADMSIIDVAGEAGLSRSGIYNYFDGREDLLVAVRAAAADRVAEALGPWEPLPDVDSFWAAFHAGSQRLQFLLSEAPELRRVLEDAVPALQSWINGFFENALDLGLVTTANRALARAATGAILAAADATELAAAGSVTPKDVATVLRAIWHA
ncbi:TetR/AcrR family transcriptional regulator [Nocardia sp. NPDC127606]|uniref:TetR/AcrR family transcriptional regulator n=1 Tax=Nocardia sp. NPDC127606 TaxID=3345406 RepID=UPI00363D672B